jgi:F0F1-type ATP synthase assembly protein I
VTTPTDNRSPLAKAYQWSSRIMVVSLEMVLPAFAGYWIDSQLSTLPLFLLIGLAVGCTGGAWHLMRLTSDASHHGYRGGDRNSSGE